MSKRVRVSAQSLDAQRGLTEQHVSGNVGASDLGFAKTKEGHYSAVDLGPPSANVGVLPLEMVFPKEVGMVVVDSLTNKSNVTLHSKGVQHLTKCLVGLGEGIPLNNVDTQIAAAFDEFLGGQE